MKGHHGITYVFLLLFLDRFLLLCLLQRELGSPIGDLFGDGVTKFCNRRSHVVKEDERLGCSANSQQCPLSQLPTRTYTLHVRPTRTRE